MTVKFMNANDMVITHLELASKSLPERAERLYLLAASWMIEAYFNGESQPKD